MIVIVGAGIAGLSLGYELVKRDVEVMILDASSVASGASGVATSYLEPRLGQTPMRMIERKALTLWESFAAEIHQGSGIDPQMRRQGQLKVTLEQNRFAFEQDLSARKLQGQELLELTGSEVLALEPCLSPDIVAGVFVPHIRWINGSQVCQALAVCIRNNGGSIKENCRVEKLEETGKGVLVHTSGGSHISTDKLVLCTGSATRLIEDLPVDIPSGKPVRGVNLTVNTSRLSKPLQRMVKHYRGNLCPRADGDLIIGTTYEPGQNSLEVGAETIDFLYRNAEPILPGIRNLPLVSVTAGLRSKVGDGTLCLGRSNENPGIYYSLGHAGSGYLRAPIIARELALFLLENQKQGLTGPFIKD